MKQWIYRHFIYWLAYGLISTLFEYSWVSPYIPGLPLGHVMQISFVVSLILLPVKMAYTYIVLYLLLNNLQNNRKGTLSIVYITIGFFIAVTLNRIVFDYVAFPLFGNYKRDFWVAFEINGYIIGMLDTGFVMGVAVALKMFRMQISVMNNEKFLVKAKLETELKFLKNQVNPHFLFNTLNSIYSLTKKKSDLAPETVVKLSKLLRFTICESNKTLIPISSEMQIIEDYLILEKLRYTEKLNVSLLTEIDHPEQGITPLILLPFVENAFKHGASNNLLGTYIDIILKLRDGNLQFSVMNNNEVKDVKPPGVNIGLTNVRRQLELMYKDFSFTVISLPESFKVELTIDLNTYAGI